MVVREYHTLEMKGYQDYFDSQIQQLMASTEEQEENLASLDAKIKGLEKSYVGHVCWSYTESCSDDQ